MAPPSPPLHEHGATAPAGEVGEGGQSPMSHASSETAAAAPPATVTAAATTSGKRSAPTSPDRMEDDAADDSAVEIDGGGAADTTDTNVQAKAAEGATVDEPDETATPPAKRRTMCGVCNMEPSKYKCARCPLAYCSVTCSRIHRDNHPPDAPAEEKESTLPGVATVSSLPPKPAPPAHPFHVLDDAPELRHLFERFPTLPARLKSIYEATQPPKAGGGPNGGNKGANPGLPIRLPNQNTRGGFGGGRGGRGGGGGMSSKPWTKEMGLRNGQKALRRARVDPGEDGDAVRAYCETVTYLLAREADGGVNGCDGAASAITNNTNGKDLTALVREELAVEANQMIKNLLDVEGRR